MTAHRWLTKRHSSLLSRACSTEGSCGSPSSRDRRRHHVLGRPRRRGAAPRRIVRWLDRRRAHPRLLRASHPVFSSRAADKVGTRPPPSHSPPPRCTARPLSPARRTERPIWAGNAAATGWWRPRQRGSATPRKLARQTCDLCPSYSPQILPYPGSPGTASGEPRQVSSISDKFSSRPSADLWPSGAQDGAWDRPGVDSPRRCGVSARPCMARSGVRLRRVDCGAPR